MAVESGLGFTVSVDDSGGILRDISADIFTLGIRTPSGVQDTSSVDVSGMKRLLLRGDGEVVITFGFDDGANLAHAVFKDYRTAQRTVTLAISGQTLSMEMVIENYDLAMAQDGSLVATATMRLASGTVPTWS